MANKIQSLAAAECLFARHVQSLNPISLEKKNRWTVSHCFVLHLSSRHVVATVILTVPPMCSVAFQCFDQFFRPKASPSRKMTHGEWKKRWISTYHLYMFFSACACVESKNFPSVWIAKFHVVAAIRPSFFFTKAKQMEAKLELLRRTMDVDDSKKCGFIEFQRSWFIPFCCAPRWPKSRKVPQLVG